jgi:two-component SAPR family response regulator
MSVMHTTVSQINKLIHNMINRQKTIVFSDRTFAQEVIGSGM